MSTILFSNDEFPCLAFEEYLGEWNQIGINDLSSNEQDLMASFLGYLGVELKFGENGELSVENESIDLDNLLLVKAADGGMFKQVYGPSVFRKDSELIIKVGGNEFAVSQDKADFKIGTLAGNLSFAAEATEIEIKDENGKEVKVQYYPATLDLMPEDGSEVEYRLRISFAITPELSPSKVKAAMKRGESIAPFLRQPGQGTGGEAGKMQDLGEGEFSVKGIRKVETNNGDRYIIELTESVPSVREEGKFISAVWSRGVVETQLKDELSRQSIDDALNNDKPVTLAVANIRQKGDKTYLDCAFRLREPRNADTPKPEAKKTKTKELVAVGADSKPAAEGQKAAVDDSIPF